MGRYPSEADGGLKALYVQPQFEDEDQAKKWREPFVKQKELNDAWSNVLNYEVVEVGVQGPSGVKFKLWSNGPDLQSNTEDDIRNWSNETGA